MVDGKKESLKLHIHKTYKELERNLTIYPRYFCMLAADHPKQEECNCTRANPIDAFCNNGFSKAIHRCNSTYH